jgi:hypothetical protein
MRLFPQILALVLIATLASTSIGIHALVLPAPHVHPAGCHGHGSPTPAPVSYQCCVAGHHQAIPGSLFSGLVSLAYFGTTEDAENVVPVEPLGTTPVSSSPGSPGITSLRI